MKTVLVVEDDENDLHMMKMACQRTGIPHLFQGVQDGEAAVDYLSGAGAFANRAVHPVPHLVFSGHRPPHAGRHRCWNGYVPSPSSKTCRSS